MSATLRRVAGQCAQCRHFEASPQALERDLPGLRVLGSGHSSVRSRDGLCHHRQRYLSGLYHCEDFERRCAGKA